MSEGIQPSLKEVQSIARPAKQPTDAERVLKSEGVDPSTTRDAIAELNKPHLIKRIANKLRPKQSSTQTTEENTKVIESPSPETLTPQEALQKLTNAHDEWAIKKIRESETSYPSSFANVIEGGAGSILSGIEYGERNVPQFQTWDVTATYLLDLSLRPGEKIEETVESQTPLSPNVAILHHRVTPDDYPKIDYNFGRGALTSQECIGLIGSSLEQDAQSALTNPDEQGIGTITKEILPGVLLHVQVVDESHHYLTIPMYAEQLKGQENSRYKVISSLASVPLVGEASVTGRAMLENGIARYKEDFHQRYDDVLTGKSPTELFWHDYEDPIQHNDIEDTVVSAVGVYKRQSDNEVPQGDSVSVIVNQNFLSSELRLYLLARMEYDLLKGGNQVQLTPNSSLDEQIGIVAPIYREFRQEQRQQKQQVQLGQWKKINSREPVNMNEEERELAIGRNVDLLEQMLVQDTPYWDLDKDEYMKDAQRGVGEGKVRFNRESDTQYTELTITYETATGKIIYVPSTRRDFLPGDYSRFRSVHINRGRKQDEQYHITDPGINTIELVQGGEGMTKSEMYRAFGASEEEAPDEENRRILPTRLLPERDETWGGLREARVKWGDSKYNESTNGDQVLLRAIQIFNQRFGQRKLD